ncbi:ATP-binding cassette, subfamily B [Chitinophaga costaii]|uniref:ATP-binding cassette, subfamily B n=1 Tax=Chitinophaga costaii TaxID=1335309 RepID=A0A1C4C8D5_9BACT|nr:ABC transporter ATP-binding protein [Chitinophaga costaii]PUZ27191.1 ABC transporter ATP-binding protein [Chitinophaga costaii]SCC15377.1 ATP-binding cassette, subfamily B [Chitinophaga costaii]
MNYNLNELLANRDRPSSGKTALRDFMRLMGGEKRNLLEAQIYILLNTGLNLTGPLLVGYSIDQYVQHKRLDGLLHMGGILIGVYLLAFVMAYLQTNKMGGVGQRMLFTLRNAVFIKLQELPVAFFNQNKAGDLISRINNDTDKVNQFFSQSLMQFVGSVFTMLGAGIFLLSINWKLGVASLAPAAFLLLFTRVISPWVRQRNARNLKSAGSLSGEIQESLQNFKVIIAFNRRDYFRKRFQEANDDNYKTSIQAGVANNLFLPVSTFLSAIAQLLVVAYGIYMIMHHAFTIGLLVSYLAYVMNFYNPVRQMAALWANLQVAQAGWDRIAQILSLHSDLEIREEDVTNANGYTKSALLEFKDVSFRYPDGKLVLHSISFRLEPGKTYALVGPTGGGKTTMASLIARLYDPTQGEVWLDGRDIRTYTPAVRSQKVGFILQEPFLFSGTVRDNLLYGNEQYSHYTPEELDASIREANLESLLGRFENGIETEILPNGEGVSLGQKQLIAFMRAVLRNPALLILDEATANIDTVTEQLLDDILRKLPATTTRVIIAHRLNTIESADEIFFVNSGSVTRAGSMQDAVNMLLHDKRSS